MKFIHACLAIAASVLFLIAPAAFAHAFPVRSEPHAGSTVSGTVGVIRIWFDSEIEPVFSTLRIVDAKGQQVNKGSGRVNPGEAELLEAAVPSLAPGTYRAFWRVIARDGHATEGDYPFTVGP